MTTIQNLIKRYLKYEPARNDEERRVYALLGVYQMQPYIEKLANCKITFTNRREEK